MLANAVCQLIHLWLTHRFREQARSHTSPLPQLIFGVSRAVFIQRNPLNSAMRQCEALLFSRCRCIVSALCRPCARGRYVRLLCPDPFPVDKSWVVSQAWP